MQFVVYGDERTFDEGRKQNTIYIKATFLVDESCELSRSTTKWPPESSNKHTPDLTNGSIVFKPR
jgi:hypothetical protein